MREAINAWFFREYTGYPDYDNIYCVPLAYGDDVITCIDLFDKKLYREIHGHTVAEIKVCPEDFDWITRDYLLYENW